jgi:hypothetical protein
VHWLYSITGDSANPHYLSLSKAIQLNKSLILSYLYANKLTEHPEVRKLGIDAKIREFIENLDLEPLPRTQSLAVHPDISTQDKSTVNNPVFPDSEGKPTGDQLQGSAFYKPEPAADMESQLPPELIDVPAQNIDQSDMRPMTHEEVRKYCSERDPNPYGSKKQVARQRREGEGISSQVPKRGTVRKHDMPAAQHSLEPESEPESDGESSDDSGSGISPPEGANPYPNTDRVVTAEDRKRWKKNRQPLYRTAYSTSTTRQTTAGIRQSEQARSAKRTYPKGDDSRNETRGKSKQSSSHHTISSNHHHASRDEASSDSGDERQKPHDYTDRHQDDAKGKGAITSDTDDYESPVEFSSRSPTLTLALTTR